MRASRWNLRRLSRTAAGAAVAAGVLGAAAYAAAPQVLPRTLHSIVSTVKNGDVNPYGMAWVRKSSGRLVRGDILVSNFNNSKNLQGTGSTIVEVSPTGSRTLFASIDARSLPGSCPGGIGLTTALVELDPGWVVVGSLPTTNGKSATAKAGCLLVLNGNGKVVETWSGHGLNGPWDMTASQRGSTAALYVTNVLNGTVAAKGSVVHRASVLRLDVLLRSGKPPLLQRTTTVGSGFPERTDPRGARDRPDRCRARSIRRALRRRHARQQHRHDRPCRHAQQLRRRRHGRARTVASSSSTTRQTRSTRSRRPDSVH